MTKRLAFFFLLFVFALMSVACAGKEAQPEVTFDPNAPTAEPTDDGLPYILDKVLLEETFSVEGAWEDYLSEEDGIEMTVRDDHYEINSSAQGYAWGLNEENHEDVVIEVSAEQRGGPDNNAYGVICRADTSNNGDGYYFLVSGDGAYSISKGEGDDVNQLVEWDSARAINKGEAVNTVRAVCIGDYLALFVNGQLMAEANDETYTSGYAGLAAASFDEEATENLFIAFDDLTIWAATEK